MTGNVPVYTSANQMSAMMPAAGQSGYYRPAPSDDWQELEEKLEEAVREGRLTQAQANKILTHIEQRQMPYQLGG